jgi:hypothetical protein
MALKARRRGRKGDIIGFDFILGLGVSHHCSVVSGIVNNIRFSRLQDNTNMGGSFFYRYQPHQQLRLHASYDRYPGFWGSLARPNPSWRLTVRKLRKATWVG